MTSSILLQIVEIPNYPLQLYKSTISTIMFQTHYVNEQRYIGANAQLKIAKNKRKSQDPTRFWVFKFHQGSQPLSKQQNGRLYALWSKIHYPMMKRGFPRMTQAQIISYLIKNWQLQTTAQRIFRYNYHLNAFNKQVDSQYQVQKLKFDRIEDSDQDDRIIHRKDSSDSNQDSNPYIPPVEAKISYPCNLQPLVNELGNAVKDFQENDWNFSQENSPIHCNIEQSSQSHNAQFEAQKVIQNAQKRVFKRKCSQQDNQIIGKRSRYFINKRKIIGHHRNNPGYITNIYRNNIAKLQKHFKNVQYQKLIKKYNLSHEQAQVICIKRYLQAIQDLQKTFKKDISLRRQLRRISDPKKYKVNVSKILYKQKKPKCQYCREQIAFTLLDHCKKQHPQSLIRQILFSHLNNLEKNIRGNFNCPSDKCIQQYNGLYQLADHIQQFHQKYFNEICDQNQYKCYFQDKIFHQCTLCNKTTKTRSHNSYHLKFSQKDYVRHLIKIHPKDCDKQFIVKDISSQIVNQIRLQIQKQNVQEKTLKVIKKSCKKDQTQNARKSALQKAKKIKKSRFTSSKKIIQRAIVKVPKYSNKDRIVHVQNKLKELQQIQLIIKDPLPQPQKNTYNIINKVLNNRKAPLDQRCTALQTKVQLLQNQLHFWKSRQNQKQTFGKDKYTFEVMNDNRLFSVSKNDINGICLYGQINKKIVCLYCNQKIKTSEKFCMCLTDIKKGQGVNNFIGQLPNKRVITKINISQYNNSDSLELTKIKLYLRQRGFKYCDRSWGRQEFKVQSNRYNQQVTFAFQFNQVINNYFPPLRITPVRQKYGWRRGIYVHDMELQFTQDVETGVLICQIAGDSWPVKQLLYGRQGYLFSYSYQNFMWWGVNLVTFCGFGLLLNQSSPQQANLQIKTAFIKDQYAVHPYKWRIGVFAFTKKKCHAGQFARISYGGNYTLDQNYT